MKLSQLRYLCDKAIAKYGDMNVGAYDKDYANSVEGEDDLHDFKIRILLSTGNLPGEAIDDNEGASETPSSHYACIFYED